MIVGIIALFSGIVERKGTLNLSYSSETNQIDAGFIVLKAGLMGASQSENEFEALF